MSNAINLAALGFGGFDTSTLVSSLVSLYQQPQTQLQTQQTHIASAQSTISGFASNLGSLSQAATQLSDPLSFEAMSATSSDPALGATALGTPAAGQWTVSVSQIAQSQRSLSSGSSSKTQPLGLSGTLAIQVGSTTKSITVSATDTLADISNSIGASGLRVQSSIAFDGSQYHLMVSGVDTGAANTMTFDESGLSSSGSYSLGLSDPASVLQHAQDAKLTVGGLAVTSATNQVTNAIPGVTLSLTQPTTAPATITIQSDFSSVEQQIQNCVAAYNAVVSAGHAAAGFGTQAASTAMLQGDSSVRNSLSQLSHLVAEQVPGATGTYGTLASVGVTLNDDGSLSLSLSALSNALSSDPTSVQQLFTSDTATGSQGIMSAMTSAIHGLTGSSGVVTSELTTFQTRTSSITKQLASMQTQATQYQTMLQTEFSQMNAALAQYKRMATVINSQNGNSSSSNNSNNVL